MLQALCTTTKLRFSYTHTQCALCSLSSELFFGYFIFFVFSIRFLHIASVFRSAVDRLFNIHFHSSCVCVCVRRASGRLVQLSKSKWGNERNETTGDIDRIFVNIYEKPDATNSIYSYLNRCWCADVSWCKRSMKSARAHSCMRREFSCVCEHVEMETTFARE